MTIPLAIYELFDHTCTLTIRGKAHQWKEHHPYGSTTAAETLRDILEIEYSLSWSDADPNAKCEDIELTREQCVKLFGETELKKMEDTALDCAEIEEPDPDRFS